MTRRHSMLVGWTVAVFAMAAFARLGAWQLQRAGEKQAMLDAATQELRHRRAKPLDVAADPGRARAHDWSAGRGTFEEGGAWLLDNQLREGRAGVRVYRVLHPHRPLPSPGAAQPATRAPVPLLVDLGWVPLPGDRSLPDLRPAPPGVVEVRGLLAPPPSSGIAMGPAFRDEQGHRLMTRVDTARMGERLGLAVPLAPRVLRLDPALPFGHARDLALLANTLPPEKHRGYALQWFALAVAVLATALLLTFRVLRPRRAA